MTELHVNVPDDVAARLAVAAAERGTSTEDVAAEVLTAHAPAARPGKQFAFIGVGHSGRGDLSERVEELLAQQLDQ